MTSGPVRDCTHPRANHQHGTYLAYVKDSCRCEPCARAGRAGNKLIAYRTVTGTHGYVDATHARNHVRSLLATLTAGQVERRSGVNRTAIRVLIGDAPRRPASRRIKRSTEAALLAVRADVLGPETSGLVDPIGTQRRLRALIALGWNANNLTKRLRMSDATCYPLLHQEDHKPIRTSTRTRVAALYDELAMTVPEPSRATTFALAMAGTHGWVPPLAWPDDDIDNPAAHPFGALTGPVKRSRPELVEDFLDTRDHHQGDVRLAADRLGVTHAALSKTLYLAKAQGADIAFHNTASGNAA